MADRFIEELLSRYPSGDLCLENELKSLKRKLDDLDFSDVDEDELIKAADEVEEKVKKHKTEQFKCLQCNKCFANKRNLNRHVISHSMTVKCELCQRLFRRKDNLRRHVLTQHAARSQGNVFPCKHCDKVFNTYQNLYQHVVSHHPLPNNQVGGRSEEPSVKDISDETRTAEPIEKKNDIEENMTSDQTALNHGVQKRTIYPNHRERYDMLSFFANIKSKIWDFLKEKLQKHGIKWYLCTQVELYKETPEGELITTRPHFRSKTYSSVSSDALTEHDLNEAFQKMAVGLENFVRDSNGWNIKEVIHVEIHTVMYTPVNGSSYVELPLTLQNARCILNVLNINDNKCFVWSVLASLHPIANSPEQVEHYEPFENELNMEGITFPVEISSLNKFEKQNSSLSVNVFTFEDKDFIPLWITKNSGRLHHVNLLLLKTKANSHYCLIKNLDRFLGRTKKNHNRQFWCSYCLNSFTKERILQEHIEVCSKHGAQKLVLPEEGKNDVLQFKNFERTLKVPFVIFADFETINKKVEHCKPNPDESSSTATTLLEPCGFGYKVVCIDSAKTKPTVIYRGKEASKKLLECLMKEEKDIMEDLQNIRPMQMTEEDKKMFESTTSCCICSGVLKPYYPDIVRHHNHLTGEFIGAAHNACNLNCKQVDFIPVIFHGLRNFDGHVLCQSMGQTAENTKIKCIPQNMERYISFSIGKLRFIDSFQFLPSSLETLVEDLVSEKDASAFSYLHEEFPDKEQSSLLLQKGIYPYDYMDSFERFNETKIPPKEAFYSEVKREGISDEQYQHACNVFRTFGMTDLGSYHDLYLQSDVILLACVFSRFRDVSLDQYGLDPAHYYSSPGLSWDACLKMTKVQLELLIDIDQILFIEEGIRGGLSQISNRYAKANNPYLNELYDPSKTTTYLHYEDANNLYGKSMIQKLPVRDFRFLTNEEIQELDILNVSIDSSTGYILQVSLKYPERLHDDHNCYPLCPERKLISDDMLSPYAKRMWKKLHGKKDEDQLPSRAKVEKLVATLEDKDHYVLHYRNLQLYVELGMEIKEIHKVLEFHQEAWMKPYIMHNTEMRKKAKSTFQKNLYKLFNCSVFGKTMENVRKHRDVRLIQTKTKLKKLTAKPSFKCCKIFNEDLVGVEMNRLKVQFQKPIYIGFCVLDLAKEIMYRFYYLYLKKRYGSKISLQFTDTDSVLIMVQTDDIYRDMLENIELFDTSDYPEDHFLQSNQNKKVLGKMKDETNGVPISEFVGLRSKAYSYICGGEEHKRLKGVAKKTIEKDLKFQSYKETLLAESQVFSTMTLIRSHSHQLYCDKVTKVGLSCFDDKRFLLNDGISSLAYGHYKIKEL